MGTTGLSHVPGQTGGGGEGNIVEPEPSPGTHRLPWAGEERQSHGRGIKIGKAIRGPRHTITGLFSRQMTLPAGAGQLGTSAPHSPILSNDRGRTATRFQQKHLLSHWQSLLLHWHILFSTAKLLVQDCTLQRFTDISDISNIWILFMLGCFLPLLALIPQHSPPLKFYIYSG